MQCAKPQLFTGTVSGDMILHAELASLYGFNQANDGLLLDGMLISVTMVRRHSMSPTLWLDYPIT